MKLAQEQLATTRDVLQHVGESTKAMFLNRRAAAQ
jgi:hypothetical protein